VEYWLLCRERKAAIPDVEHDNDYDGPQFFSEIYTDYTHGLQQTLTFNDQKPQEVESEKTESSSQHFASNQLLPKRNRRYRTERLPGNAVI